MFFPAAKHLFLRIFQVATIPAGGTARPQYFSPSFGCMKMWDWPPIMFVPHSLRKPYYPPTQRAEWVPDAVRLEIWSSHMMLKVMLTLDLHWENVHKLFKPQHQWQDCSLFCYLKHAEDSLRCFVGAILWANLGWISYWLMSVYTWNRVIEYPPRHACSVDYLLVYHVLGVTSHFWVWNNPFS